MLEALKKSGNLFANIPDIVKIGALPIGFWLASYPGIYSPDSFYVINLVNSNHLDNRLTVWWYFLVYVTSLGGINYAFTTLFNSLIFAFALFLTLKLIAPKSSIKFFLFIYALPIVGLFPLHLWHDVPATWGSLLLTTVLIETRMFAIKFSMKQKLLLTLSLMGLLTRGNSIITIFLILFFLSVFLHKKRILKLNVLIFTTFFILDSVFPILLGFSGSTPHWQSISPFLADIQCVAQQHPEFISNSDWTILEKSASKSVWISQVSCASSNPILWDKSTNLNEIDQDYKQLLGVWSRVIRQDPKDIFVGRVQRAAPFLPPLIFPSPPQVYLFQYPNQTKMSSPLIIQRLLSLTLLVTNACSPLLGWSGLWAALTLPFICYLARVKQNDKLLIIWLLSEFSLIPFILDAPSNDARYGMYSIIIGIATSFSAATVFVSKLRTKIIRTLN